jgi:hypothetical protein
VTGCTSDETPSTATNPGASNPAPGPRNQNVPPVTRAEPSKDGMAKATSTPTDKAGAAKTDDSPKLEAPKTEPAKEKTSDATTLTDKELASIKELPAAEQALAIKQAVCPVSGDHLGGEMGKPIKVTAEGRTFFLCCEGCQDAVKKDPKGVIAKLDARTGKK